MRKLYDRCTLCPRRCGVNRNEKEYGFCGLDSNVRIARASLHFWEEPELSGEAGSGTVFFAGCNLKCVYCQNYGISRYRDSVPENDGVDVTHRSGQVSGSVSEQVSGSLSEQESGNMVSGDHTGRIVSAEELADIFLDLQSQGALNINLVTAAMFMPDVLKALDIARGCCVSSESETPDIVQGHCSSEPGPPSGSTPDTSDQGKPKLRVLEIPVVYNSSGYESVELLRMMEGYIDIYLPDLKYLDSDLARELSGAPDYPDVACAAIEEMVRQTRNMHRQSSVQDTGEDDKSWNRPDDGKKSAVIVRHLVLPGHVKESNRVIKYLYDTYGDEITISIMSQYTPIPQQLGGHPELNRRITRREYDRVVDHAISIGVTNAYIQERDVATQSFIPQWDIT